MDRALGAWGLGLDEGLHGAHVETAPTAATMTAIVQRATAATDVATVGSAPVGADMDDDGSRGAIDADVLDEGAIDAEQLAPQVSRTHDSVIPFGPKAPSNARVRGQRYEKMDGSAGLEFCHPGERAAVQPPAGTSGEVRHRTEPPRTALRHGILANLGPYTCMMGPPWGVACCRSAYHARTVGSNRVLTP